MSDLVAGPALVEALHEQQIVSYVDVASTAIFIYEVIINLSVEIEHIWMKKWSFLTVIYVLQRYLPFFDTVGLGLQRHVGAHLSTADCVLIYQIAGWSIITGLVLSEVLLTIRIWAVWERSTPIAIGLGVFSLACGVPSYIFTGDILSSLKFTTLPGFYGCFFNGGSRLSILFWVLLMVYDIGAMVMMLIPGFTAIMKGKGSELIKTMYRDGVMFYVLNFLISMANVVLILSLPNLSFLLNSFGRVLHSLLASRAILRIRQLAWQRNDTDQTLSEIRFTQNEHAGDDSYLQPEQRTRSIRGVEI